MIVFRCGIISALFNSGQFFNICGYTRLLCCGEAENEQGDIHYQEILLQLLLNSYLEPMKKILLACFVLFSFNLVLRAQNGEKKGWPSAERFGFLSECIKSAMAGMSEDSARFYCWCMQEKVEKKYPTVEEVAKLTAEEMNSPEWKKEINACLTGGGWKSADRSEFLTNCIEVATTNIGAEKAKNYCECMLFKVEQRFPNSADVSQLTSEKLNSPEWKIIVQGCRDF
jgi:hypothetical protein